MEDVRGFRRPNVRLKSGLAINCAKQRGFGNESVSQPHHRYHRSVCPRHLFWVPFPPLSADHYA
jgi:hypothetical protein